MSGNGGSVISGSTNTAWVWDPHSGAKPTQVTDGERFLYGDFAPVIRDFGSAVAAVQQASRTLAKYVDEERSTQATSEPPESAFWRAFGVAASVLDNVGEAQRELVREALHEVERQRAAIEQMNQTEDGSVN